MLRPHPRNHYDEPLGRCRTLLQSPSFRALGASLALWLLAFTYCKFRYWRDPNSAFFDSKRAYELHYSAHRLEEVRAFRGAAIQTDIGFEKADQKPTICVAITTLNREGDQYLEDMIGSLLAGLTDAERAKIWMTIFFADTDPKIHPAYHEPWIRSAVDEMATFNLSAEVMEDLKEREQSRDWMKKAIFDYTYVLTTCLTRNTPYILILSDDLIATPVWLSRTLHALQTLKTTTRGGWLYLRLFFTESTFKFRSTDFWYNHMFLTFLLFSLLSVIILLLLRSKFPPLRPHLPNPNILTLSTITVPAFIALIFMIGKYSISLSPSTSHEVFKMNAYGCCGQALLYPRHEVGDLIDWLKWKKEGDEATWVEVYANEMGLDRWALGRQVVQHVGRGNERGNENRRKEDELVWAYWFEGYDRGKLEREHRLLVGEMF